MEPKKYLREDLIEFIIPEKEIGFGGFSKVYSGKLDSKKVAIKVLLGADDFIESFETEMKTMATASHPNLVTLHGYCNDSDMKALVYDFMENGSLDKILFDNHRNLEWGELYRIAIGTAKGLAYLHHGCGNNQIIHRDMKPANVLVDENYSAKITDFGLAKILSNDADHYTITHNKGTEGYIAPEFGKSTSHITNKCDVYSYGVMLFEVLARKKNGNRGPSKWGPAKIWSKFEEGKLDEHLESFDIQETHKGKAKILSKVAFWCCQYTVELRPSMSKVVEFLEKEILPNDAPLPFQDYFPPFVTSMMSSLEVHERLASAIPNPTLVTSRPKFINNAFETLPSELGTARPQQFLLSDLKIFTSNFSKEIGRGKCGVVVYKGQFLDGTEVAVKVLPDKEFFDKTFMDVVTKLKLVNHPNIVKFHGYCFEGNIKALVYEYIGNGSLGMILYNNPCPGIEWEKLHRIAIETAVALSVLNAAGIIRHDIKASNILLDSNHSPKIKSYGVNDLIKMKSYGEVQPKRDVYGFGILLFEVLSRSSINQQCLEKGFPGRVWKWLDKGNIGRVIKVCKINKKYRKEAMKLSKVALWCAQFHPNGRPSMSTVVEMLEKESSFQEPPNPFPDAQFFSSDEESP